MGEIANTRVLLLSEDRGVQRSVRRALVSAGCVVDIEMTGQHAAAYGLVVADLSGLDVSILETLQGQEAPPPILILATELADDDRLIELLNAGTTNVVAKHSANSSRALLDESELIETCAKLLSGDIFGLEKYVPSSSIHLRSHEIRHTNDRHSAVAAVGRFLEEIDCYKALISTIQNCADELMMNAIFSAPRDEDGESKYQEVDRSITFALLESEWAVLNYACDGRYIYVGVADQFGALSREVALEYLHNGLVRRKKAPRDQLEGGAGIGLTMVARSISQLIINVQPGVKTEVIAGFYIRSGARAFRTTARSLNMFYCK